MYINYGVLKRVDEISLAVRLTLKNLYKPQLNLQLAFFSSERILCRHNLHTYIL